MSLILLFLYPPLFLSRYQNRGKPNKSRRCLLEALTQNLTKPVLLVSVSWFLSLPKSWGSFSSHVGNGKRIWKLISFQSTIFFFFFLPIPSPRQRWGDRGMLWFLKCKYDENLYLTSSFSSLNDIRGIWVFWFFFFPYFSLRQLIIDFKYFCSDTLYFSCFLFFLLALNSYETLYKMEVSLKP